MGVTCLRGLRPLLTTSPKGAIKKRTWMLTQRVQTRTPKGPTPDVTPIYNQPSLVHFGFLLKPSHQKIHCCNARSPDTAGRRASLPPWTALTPQGCEVLGFRLSSDRVSFRSEMQYYTILYYTVLYYSVLYCTILYTRLN